MAQTADSTSSTEASAEGLEREPTGAPDGVSLGRVVGAHGLHGELRVRATADELMNLLSVQSVRLARDEGGARPGEYQVESARQGRAGECRLVLRGVSDRDAAEALRGATVLVRSEDLPKLPPGEFYAYELVGCEVFTADGRSIGTVRSILETGASDVLVIEGADRGEQLVPAVEPLLRQVDLAARRIVIDPPPGLLHESAGGQETGARDPESEP